MAERAESLERWVHTFPVSKIAYPATLFDRFKYYFWRVLTPVHPYMRDVLDKLGYVEWRYAHLRENGRQVYLLGCLAPGQTPQTLTKYLIDQGYGNHFVALRDRGELVSLRYAPSFKYQYHLRIFKDGEVRGHYEYTPECHPFRHDQQVDMEERRDYFLNLLGERIIPAQK